MHIAWSFLDKRSATIAAVRAYKNMSFIIENTPDNIREQIIIMCSPNSSQISETPRVHNPHGGETRLAAIIDELDVLRERYRQALEYMDWFQPAWDKLSDKEKTILSEMYMCESMRSGAVKRLEQMLGYSNSQIDRMRSKALVHLSHLLFGI